MTTWLIVAAYVAMAAFVARVVARRIVESDDIDTSDGAERTLVGLIALGAAAFWPLTLLFLAWTSWLLPKESSRG